MSDMDSEQNEAAQKGQGEPARSAPSQNEDSFWEEPWPPEEDAVPPEPAWLSSLEVGTPPEPAWDDPIWGEEPPSRIKEGAMHPSGQWQVVIKCWRGQDEAFVRNVHTNQYAWRPKEAEMIVWSPDGTEAAVIRKHYELALDHQGILLRQEFWYAFDRYTWPEQKRLSACPIRMPSGWIRFVAISPRKDLAIFQWISYTGETGLEYIVLSEEGDYQLRNSGFRAVIDPRWLELDLAQSSSDLPVRHKWPTYPVFSPSGRFIALALDGDWDYIQGQYVTPALENLYRLGELFILD